MKISPPPINDSVAGTDKQFTLSWKMFITTAYQILFGVQNYLSDYFVEPADGFSILVPSNVETVTLAPLVALTAGTIQLPLDPTDGQRVMVSSSQAIAGLVVTAASTIMNDPTALNAGEGFAYRYNLSQDTWYRLY